MHQPPASGEAAFDPTLLEGISRAHYWRHLIDTGVMESGNAIARAEGLHHTYVCDMLRLTLIAPDLIERWMAGQQPRALTLDYLLHHRLPVDWLEQRAFFTNFDAQHRSNNGQ